MRSMIAHYDAHVTVRTDPGQVTVLVATIASLVLYVGVRLWYLASGKTAEFADGGRVKVCRAAVRGVQGARAHRMRKRSDAQRTCRCGTQF